MVVYSSLAKAKAALASIAPDIALTKVDCGEYRITFTESKVAEIFPDYGRTARLAKMESVAAYESELDSAVETAKAMHDMGLKPDGVPAIPVKLESHVKHGLTYVDLTPTWESLIPLFVALIENGDSKGRATAISELKRLAAFADSAIAESKESAK